MAEVEVTEASPNRATVRVGNKFLIFIPDPKKGARKIAEFAYAQVNSGEQIPRWLEQKAKCHAIATMNDHRQREVKKEKWRKAQLELPLTP